MKYLSIFLTLLILFLLISNKALALQGCCSHHGGVCGGSCCDGSALSAACGGGTIYIPNTTQSNTILPIFPTPTPPVRWCGVGEWYSTKSAASAAIDSYKTDLLQPYVDLQRKYDDTNTKKWIYFFAMIVLPILIYNHKKQWASIILGILTFIFMCGGFILLWPF